jgi:hypothetical protein
VSRRALAWLIAGAVAATACYFLVARPPGNASYLIFYLGTPAVAVAFLAAGLAVWLRWPGCRVDSPPGAGTRLEADIPCP